MSFSCEKGELYRCFNRLDRPVEESRPDRQPDWPVDPTSFRLWVGNSCTENKINSPHLLPFTATIYSLSGDVPRCLRICFWRWLCLPLQVTQFGRDWRKEWDYPISGRVGRASATETVDTGSIPGRVNPKTIKIGIHSFPA